MVVTENCLTKLIHRDSLLIIQKRFNSLMKNSIPKFNHSITQSLNHSITQSLNHSITQSLNHSITQSLNLHSLFYFPKK